MTHVRDAQKSGLYRWERKMIAPHDKSLVNPTHLQVIVDHVWAEVGLQYPPKVKVLPKQNKSCWADATPPALDGLCFGSSVPLRTPLRMGPGVLQPGGALAWPSRFLLDQLC